jgi:hypothetical protein
MMVMLAMAPPLARSMGSSLPAIIQIPSAGRGRWR